MKNRTYRYFTGKPAYPFGFGLSYTSFAYSDLKLDKQIKASSTQHVSVRVRNAGTATGDEVVQAYLSYPGQPSAPIHALKSFQRVHLNPGEEKQVDLMLLSRDLAQVDEKGASQVNSGEYELWVGGGQPGCGAPGVAGHFAINGLFQLPR